LDQKRWQWEVFRRSLFVLATNQTLEYLEDEEELLRTYKAQQSVERSFRFIKDPYIVASSFFVKARTGGGSGIRYGCLSVGV